MSQNINQYINAHLQWIVRLTTAIYGGQIPDRDTATVDNACALGKWIHGEGSRYENTLEFPTLREKHRQFHISVGRIIDLVKAGNTDEAKVEITSGTFRQLSREVINLLSQLKRSVSSEKNDQPTLPAEAVSLSAKRAAIR